MIGSKIVVLRLYLIRHRDEYCQKKHVNFEIINAVYFDRVQIGEFISHIE